MKTYEGRKTMKKRKGASVISSEKLRDELAVTMADAGIPPDLIWIWIRTGLLPFEENRHLMTHAKKRECREAAREYDEGQADVDGWIAAARQRLKPILECEKS